MKKFFAFLGVIMVVMIVVTVGTNVFVPKDPKAWPLPGPAPTPKVEDPLSWDWPVMTQDVTNDMPEEEQQRLESRNMRQIIGKHPDPETRARFAQSVYSDELRQALIYGNHQFTGSLVTRLEPHKRMPGALDAQPYLQFNADFARTMSEDNIVTLWATLQHEMVHYDQFVHARENNLSAESASFMIGLIPSAEPETMCAVMWDHEVEAYQESCEFIYRAGLQDRTNLQYSFCPWYQTEYFQQAFFLDHLSRVENGTETRVQVPGSCLPVLADLAGHPNPGAFKQE